MTDVKIYGADWCSMTVRARSHLDKLGVAYEYIDVEDDSAASEWVKKQNGGKELKPTLDIQGEILAEPSNHEIDKVLRSHNLLA